MAAMAAAMRFASMRLFFVLVLQLTACNRSTDEAKEAMISHPISCEMTRKSTCDRAS